MKNSLRWLPLLSFIALPLWAVQTKEGEGMKHLEQFTHQLSLKLLLEERERSFEKEFLPLCRSGMAEEMRRTPSVTAHRKNSLPVMRQYFQNDFQRRFAGEAEKLFAAYPGAFSQAEREKYLESRRKKNLCRADEIFTPLYESVRLELAAEQRKKLIFSAIYPTVEEVEKLDDRALSAKLLVRFENAAKTPVMEENLALVQSKVVTPVIAEARQQQRLQRELLAKLPAPGNLWKTGEIEAQLTRDLEAALVRAFSKNTMRYPLFPATKKELQERAAKIPVERLASAMGEQLTQARYQRLLESSPALHRTPEESWRQCCALWYAQMRRNAMEKCRVPSGITIDDQALQRAFCEVVARRFRGLRERFAGTQLKTCRPVVATWKPQMAETELFASSGRKKLPGLSEPPKCSGTLIVESEALLKKALTSALEKEADRLSRQMNAVGAFYSEIAAECTADQAKRQEASQSFWLRLFGRRAGELTLSEIVKVYSKRIEKESSAPLFPSVEKEIDVRSRAILQQLRDFAQTKSAASKQEEKKKKRVELTFRLSLASDRELLLQCGKKQWKFKDGALPASEIRKIFASRTPETEMQIKLIVSGGSIYYRTVDELRTLLKECAADAKIEDSYQR